MENLKKEYNKSFPVVSLYSSISNSGKWTFLFWSIFIFLIVILIITQIIKLELPFYLMDVLMSNDSLGNKLGNIYIMGWHIFTLLILFLSLITQPRDERVLITIIAGLYSVGSLLIKLLLYVMCRPEFLGDCGVGVLVIYLPLMILHMVLIPLLLIWLVRNIIMGITS